MNIQPWLETIGVLFVSMIGLVFGRQIGHMKKNIRWPAMIGVYGVLGVIFIIQAGLLDGVIAGLSFWITGRSRYVILAFIIPFGMTCCLVDMASRFKRILICVIMGLYIGGFVLLPFVSPAVFQGDMAGLKNRIDLDGVCLQSQPYTCGPAAAVSALRILGYDAQESRLSLDARTCPILGTTPWNLYQSIKNNYGRYGVDCRMLKISRLSELPTNAVSLVILRDTAITNHCVALLGMSPEYVTIADPLVGRIRITRSYLAGQIQPVAIVLKIND